MNNEAPKSNEELLIDALENAETAVERSDQVNAEVLRQARELFKRIEQRLKAPAPPLDTHQLNEWGQRSFGAIQQVASQMSAELDVLKPAERLKRLKRWRRGGIALIALLSLLIAFAAGIFASVSHPIFSKAILPYAQDTSTCEGLGGWIQEANGPGRLCVISIN